MGTKVQKGLAARVEREAELKRHERKLRALAKRLRTAAERIDLAATYAGDGAAITAEVLTIGGRTDFARGQRTAMSLALEVVRALNTRKWQR
jgi:hypothetical protein